MDKKGVKFSYIFKRGLKMNSISKRRLDSIFKTLKSI